MTNNKTLQDAINLAMFAHREQVDKAGQPYTLHLFRVMTNVESETAKIVAILHDLVEDTEYTFEMLNDLGYSKEVIDALKCLTKKDNEPYSDFIERVKTNPVAIAVKIADIKDNMDLTRLFEVEEEDLQRLKKYHTAYRLLRG